MFGGAGCDVGDGSHTIRVAGAQIPVELVESWLGRARSPRIAAERVQFYLSQQGFESLLAGECDVACTDRPISASELAKFGAKRPEGYRVAFYGFGLYVHPENPLDSIFAGQLKAVLQNQVYDWKELGGRAGPIRVYGPRKSTSGGAVLMKQANIWLADPTWIALDSDREIVDRVADDPQALGFAGVGYDGPVRYLGLRMQRGGAAALPSADEIESGQYGLAKLIFVYVMPSNNPAVDAVLDFLYSRDGQVAIERTGVWPVAWERAPLGPTQRKGE